MPIVLGLEESALIALYELCHAVLLAGGEDVDPRHYNEQRSPRLKAVSAERDAVELLLARRCFADKKPLFGICRGLQVLNVALGGTLYQDLPSELEGAQGHNRGGDERNWQLLSHDISFSSESKIGALLGAKTLGVNSIHHQAVKDLAHALKVTARSPDGVVEAIEAQDERFCIAVQCHPEALWQAADKRWIKVFEAFITAAKCFQRMQAA